MSARARHKPSAAPAGFLPYGRQTIEDDDIDAVAEALRGDYLTTGPTIGRFEDAFAQKIGVRHAVVCANGTAALYMAAKAMKLSPGSKVIVPAVTFLATASAPHLAGAEIVFADVDPNNGLMRPCDLAAALARAGRADALFNVHLAGQCDDLEEIHRIARAADLRILDDACHAVGTEHISRDGSRHVIGANAFCDMSVFSFHPVKTMTLGEGGAVTTNDPAADAALRLVRNHGMVRAADDFENRGDAFDAGGGANPWYYELQEPGFNFRVTDIQCALGLSQLAKLDRFVAQRRALAAAYETLLAPLAPRIMPMTRTHFSRPAWHLYAVLVDFPAVGMTRAEFMRRLAECGVGSQVHYFPLHRQRYFAHRYGALSLPGADSYYARTLSLPLYPTMRTADVAHVAAALKTILRVK
jgi:UDP-4-amino-4,6-dideoxy-N-acetyl-beta-L-altrosamine transaminase